MFLWGLNTLIMHSNMWHIWWLEDIQKHTLYICQMISESTSNTIWNMWHYWTTNSKYCTSKTTERTKHTCRAWCAATFSIEIEKVWKAFYCAKSRRNSPWPKTSEFCGRVQIWAGTRNRKETIWRSHATTQMSSMLMASYMEVWNAFQSWVEYFTQASNNRDNWKWDIFACSKTNE